MQAWKEFNSLPDHNEIILLYNIFYILTRENCHRNFTRLFSTFYHFPLTGMAELYSKLFTNSFQFYFLINEATRNKWRKAF